MSTLFFAQENQYQPYIVARESAMYFTVTVAVCVCVCACVRACVRACVCVQYRSGVINVLGQGIM